MAMVAGTCYESVCGLFHGTYGAMTSVVVRLGKIPRDDIRYALVYERLVIFDYLFRKTLQQWHAAVLRYRVAMSALLATYVLLLKHCADLFHKFV